MRRAVKLLTLTAAVAVLILLAVAATFPRIATDVALASAGWMLTDYAHRPDQTPLSYAGRKVLATALQHHFVAEFCDARPLAGRSDVDKVAERLASLKGIFLSDKIVAHQAASWPVLFSGLGYCDQINAVAAEMLARDFAHAQIFMLLDREQRTTPHTIGRVWSAETGDWLYFDAFFASPVVFVMRDGRPLVLSGEAGPEYLELYALAQFGRPMNEYSRTYPGYLMARAIRALQGDGTESIAKPAAGDYQITPAGVDPLALHPRERDLLSAGDPDDAESTRVTTSSAGQKGLTRAERWAIRRIYLEGRLAQLRGDVAGAARAYATVARRARDREGVAILAVAAEEYNRQMSR